MPDSPESKSSPDKLFPPGPRPTRRLDVSEVYSSGVLKKLEQAGRLADLVITRGKENQDYETYKGQRDSLQKEAERNNRRKNKVSGIDNENALEEDAEIILKKCFEKGFKVGIIMGDLDHFKKEVNDKHGHNAGDETIRETGQRLVKGVHFRSTDTLIEPTNAEKLNNGAYNLHGDEYAILLPNTDNEGISRAAARINKEILETYHIHDNNGDKKQVNLSFSQGGYIFDPSRMNLEEIENERQLLTQEEQKKPPEMRKVISRELSILNIMKRKADAGLIQTKLNGKNGFTLNSDDNPIVVSPNALAEIPR